MPMSDYQHIPTVLHYAVALGPRRVLDVGVGMGTYGFLLREFIDVAKERVQRSEWQTCIEGIEIFEAYRNPIWAYAYDRVHIGDVREILPTLPSYDLVLLNDVLEHFERNEARELTRESLRHGTAVVATTPNREYPQGTWAGNEAETHRALLDASDFTSLVVQTRVGITTCYVCSDDSAAVEKIHVASRSCPVAQVPRQPLIRRVKRRAARELRQAVSLIRS